MCGIFAVLREPAKRPVPDAAVVGPLLDSASKASDGMHGLSAETVGAIDATSAPLHELNTLLKGSSGVRAMLADDELVERIETEVAAVDDLIAAIERELDRGGLPDEVELEDLNQAMSTLKDATWAIRRDRLRTASAVSDMIAGTELRQEAVEGYLSIQLALSAIDRLEVRGRDSAGISVVIAAPSNFDEETEASIRSRSDELFLSNAVDVSADGKTVVFVYKAAAEIGALGDNVKHLRSAVLADGLLRKVLHVSGVQTSVVAHTRWASVGTVSEPNTHPVDARVLDGKRLPCVVAALNGDVDNHAELKADEDIHVAEEITTDTKVIPVMTAKRLQQGTEPLEAFRDTVARFQGSVAIASAAADHPDRILLGVLGSGQGCYVGIAEDSYLVASEPYGLVEECARYIRLDGESASAVSGKRGQVVELLRDGAGTLTSIKRISTGGEELPVTEEDLSTIEVTTRDIDRGGADHFLLKEISESPSSVKRTLRGKILESGGKLSVSLSEEAFPQSIRAALASGAIKQIVAIGQGTASVASSALAAVLETVSTEPIAVSVKPATELSGFGLRDDMSDMLIVAVSQSGTTTDTNRTVDMVRSRGARVIAIVNRRQSDLTERADGVFYTSDGRDVEMSVASTKAFYAQVTAASLLGISIAEAAGRLDKAAAQGLLTAFRQLPEAMLKVIAKRDEIGRAARKFAPYRRSWAIVGNGSNFIAARELRIKLSELCYKSIAVDVTEDKKHIDLSAEPMILVCAAGLTGSNAVDVGKEVAIYKAHKAAAIVIASEGATFDGVVSAISVPALHPFVDFILSTVAGHLFGYEAALAVDAQARLMRVARAIVEDVAAVEWADAEEMFSALKPALAAPASEIIAEISSGAINGHLEPSTATRVVSLLRYGTGAIPLDYLEIELGRPTSPYEMVGELVAALSLAVDELTRPIDAVKHQAKTVTVGISRTEDTFADNGLVKEAIAAGASRDGLGYRSMRTLAALQPAVSQVVGFTRYEVEGEIGEGTATLRVLEKGGVAAELPSRAESDPRLTGTKHRAAYERLVTVGRGQRDEREVVIIPESKDQHIVNITLLHVRFDEYLDAETMKAVLTGYRNRYSAIVDAVTETEPDFDDSLLAQIPVIDLLVEPVWVLARKWRK